MFAHSFSTTSYSFHFKFTVHYLFAFNGKENDNEVKGDGNQQDYGKRIYDPRVGKFLSVDPITKKYPELTPYQFASNSTIIYVDIDGLEGAILQNSDIKGDGYKPVPCGNTTESKIVGEVFGIAGGVLFIIVGGPVGLTMGPSSIGLATGKLIGHLFPQTFNQDKVNKAPSSITGTLSGSVNSSLGGDFKTGALWGDLVQGLYELKAGYPIKDGIDLSSEITTFTGVLKTTVDIASTSSLITKNNDIPDKTLNTNSDTYSSTNATSSKKSTQKKTNDSKSSIPYLPTSDDPVSNLPYIK